MPKVPTFLQTAHTAVSLSFYDNDGSCWPYNGSYDGWWGHDTLPKLNYEGSDKLVEYILNVAKKIGWSPPYSVDGCVWM